MTQMTGRLAFTTNSLPERDRFPAFCEDFIRRYTALDILRPDNNSRFRASIELQRAGALDIGYVVCDAADFLRSPRLLRDGDDALCIMLPIRGEAHQVQCDIGRMLQPDEGIICDNAYSGELRLVVNSEFWMLRCPRRKIADLLPGVDRFAGAKLERDAAALRLLLGHLGASRQIALSDGVCAAGLYGEHIADLIALALGARGDARALIEQRGVRTVRRDAILREITRHLADPELSAATVGSRLGITARYVGRLLEETGRSFSEHLLDQRLRRAAVLLRDPGAPARKIADIAFACGFGDLSYFNRAFRRRYGATPSDMREAARRAED